MGGLPPGAVSGRVAVTSVGQMATETNTTTDASHETDVRTNSALRLGSAAMAVGSGLFALSGVRLAALILAGQGALESGVDIGMTTAELAAVSPALPPYIAHIRMAAAGLFVAVGIAGAALAWYGVRDGRRWAWSAAVLAYIAGGVIGIPMHYSGAFHVDHATHLGPAYAVLALFFLGAAVAFYGLRAAERSA